MTFRELRMEVPHFSKPSFTELKLGAAHSFEGARGSTVMNPLTPNDQYRGRTAPLTSKRRI